MIGTRIITKDRVPLYTLLPLEAPLILFLDPSDSCCLACNFCPTGSKELMKEVGRPLQQMDFDLYNRFHNFTKINGYSISKRIRVLIENDIKNEK